MKEVEKSGVSQSVHAPQQVHAASAPAPVTVSKFTLSVSSADFSLGLGATRFAFSQDGNPVAHMVEYSSLNVMSPVAVKQLMTILQKAVGNYEAIYGLIPLDPSLIETLPSTEGAANSSSKKPSAPKKRALSKRSTH